MNTESSKALHVLGGVVVGIVFGIIIGIVMGSSVVAELTREAINHGAAEYVLVNGGPDTKFQWKDKP